MQVYVYLVQPVYICSLYRYYVDYCKLGPGIGELCDLVHKLSRRPCAETRLNCTFQPCQGGTFMVMIRSELSK